MAPASPLQPQIDQLRETMTTGLNEIKAMLTGLDTRLRNLETQEAGCHPIVNARLDAAWRRLDELEAIVKADHAVLIELVQTNRILKWLLGVVTAILTTVLIGLVTGSLRLMP